MNPLSSHQKTVSRLFFICLTMLLILFPSQTAAAQSDQTLRQRSFKRYGFISSGFSSEQEAIIQIDTRVI